MTTPNTQTIQFLRRGEVVTLNNVPPSSTLLEVLREDLGLTGTKEGCGEGDCGACTVVLGEANGETLTFKAVNSCIRLAHSVHGLALWTVEDLSPANAGKPGNAASQHPAQEAMVQCHASQCGFCTPGFVMSLFGMYQNHVLQGQPITRELAQTELSGNLCRCTGYRPILDAAQQMASLPTVRLDHPAISRQLAEIQPQTPDVNHPYQLPGTLAALLAARAAQPKAQLVAGCTDVGLWVTKMHKQFETVIDVSRVTEMRRIEQRDGDWVIGAAATLQDTFTALLQRWPELTTFAARFAGLPVRNSGTLGGNVANGSPIGDSMPLLIALGANVVLMSRREDRTHHRELPLEQLYTGYRTNIIAADEVLAWINVPKATPTELCRVYKISKRFDDDISAVGLALNLQVADGRVVHASIGVGGVAATPVRASQTEAALQSQPWTTATVQQAMTTLRGEFSPISDMRASASYRVQVLGNLLQRFWLESQGRRNINLESFTLQGASA